MSSPPEHFYPTDAAHIIRLHVWIVLSGDQRRTCGRRPLRYNPIHPIHSALRKALAKVDMAQFGLYDRARSFDQRGPSVRERYGSAPSSSDGISEHEALLPISSVASLAPAYNVHAFLAGQEYSLIFRCPDV